MQETFSLNSREYCQYAEQGPTFAQIMEGNSTDRGYVFHQRAWNEASIVPHTEQDGLLQLNDFLDHVTAVAARTENPLLQEEAEAFRQNLVFIGEQEKQRAIDGIARHILEKMQQGTEVYL